MNGFGSAEPKDIARRLKAAREVLGYERAAPFYAEAGISGTAYQNWEAGGTPISLPNAIRVRERYGLSLDWIYLGIDTALPKNISKALSSMPRDSHSSTSKVSTDD